MERRVLFAIFLSFLVLYVYQALVTKPVSEPVGGSPAPASSSAAAPGGRGTTPPAAAAPTPSEASRPPATTRPAAAPLVSDTTERDVRVETRDVIAVFTNRGARLKSWRLKGYFDPQRQAQELIENTLNSAPLPFTLRTADESTNATLNDALYVVSGAPVNTISSPLDLRFEYRDDSGLHAIKEFHLEPTSYVLAFRPTITKASAVLTPTIEWGPAVGGDTGEVSSYSQKAEALFFQNEKVQRMAASDLLTQPVFEGDFKFVGVDDNYFMTVALFTGPAKVSYQPASVPPSADSKAPPRELIAFSIDVQKLDGPIRFFAGPKDFDVLVAVDRDLTRGINFGMFSVIVVPLLRSLKWVNAFAGNYGWSIVILTIMINAIMFPLRHKSAVSMRKMQELQPQVKAIQDRYAKLKSTDPAKQKMNQEMMALYRERGVNPASGCVPMILTFPVLFAMWALLQTSIELRGAPWFGWIHDLSVHDPYYVLPLVMGATQVWQQRITPATGMDPAQQKMMMFMPVIFTVMFLWLPAGAAIYYGVTNIWVIGQQYMTNYLLGPPIVRGPSRPPAERKVKRVGGGKTDAAAREQ